MLILILLQVFLATAALGQIIISAPSSLIQYQTTTLTWTGGNGTYMTLLRYTDAQPHTMYTSIPSFTSTNLLSSTSYSH
jgi:hypothetical protein